MVAPLPSKLDQRQILQAVLDEEQGRLRVDAVASISNVSIVPLTWTQQMMGFMLRTKILVTS